MKRWIIPAAVLLAGALWFLNERSADDPVPVMKAIGLPAAVDQTQERTRAVARNLIYENPSADPKFYDDLVAKVAAYAAKSDLTRDDVRGTGHKFVIDGDRFKESDLTRHVAFVSPQGGFSCILYDGRTYVLVVLESSY